MRALMILMCPPILIGMLLCLNYLLPTSHSYSKGYGYFLKSSAEPLLSEVIEEARRANGLPRGLIQAVIQVESNWREDAYNAEENSQCAKSGRKGCGSVGLMGIVPRWHGQPRDWADNIRKGAKHLGKGYRKTKSVWAAAKHYNGTGRAAEIYANKVVKNYEIWKRRS